MSNSDSPRIQFISRHEIAEKIAREAWVFHERGNELSQTDLPAARQQWRLAQQKYEEGLRYVPDSPVLMNCLAGLLSEEADRIEEDDLPAAIANWQLALNLCSRLALALPDAWQAWFNWGNTLHAQAQATCARDMDMAQESWYFAGQKFARAFKVDPNQLIILIKWATCLAAEGEAQAMFQQNYDAANEKWLQAEQKFTQLFEADPAFDGLVVQWCIRLLARADAIAAHDPAQAKACRAKALEKIKHGLFFDPENMDLLHLWSNILIDEAREATTTDPELASRLFQQAIEKLQALLRKGPAHVHILMGIVLALECQAELTTDPLLLQEINDQSMLLQEQLQHIMLGDNDDEDQEDQTTTSHGSISHLH